MNGSCQQFSLYAAEAGVGSEAVAPDVLQSFVDELRELDYWKRNFANVLRIDTHVLPASARNSVGGWHGDGFGQVELLPRHLTQLYVIHEVCHVLAEARYDSHSHDPWFARTYLELVYAALGSDAYAALAASFERGGIDHQTTNSNPAGRAI